MNFNINIQYIFIATIVIQLLAMLFLLFYKPHTNKIRVVILLFVVIIIWQTSFFLLQSAPYDFPWRNIIGRIYAFSIPVVIMFVSIAIQILLHNSIRLFHLIIVIMSMLISGCCAVLGFSTSLFLPQYTISLLFFISIVIASGFFLFGFSQLLLQYFQEQNTRHKIHLGYVFLALFPSFAFILLIHGVTPLLAVLYGIQTYTFTTIYTVSILTLNVLPFIFFIGIVRHRLFGIKVAISRSWLDSFLSALFSFSIAAWLYWSIWPVITTISGPWSGVVLSGSVIVILICSALINKALLRWLSTRLPKKYIPFEQWQIDEQRLIGQSDYAQTIITQIIAEIQQHATTNPVTFFVYDHVNQCMSLYYPLHSKKQLPIPIEEPWVQWCNAHSDIINKEEIVSSTVDQVVQDNWAEIATQYPIDYIVPLQYGKRLVGIIFLGENKMNSLEKEFQSWMSKRKDEWSLLVWQALQIQFFVYQQVDERISSGADLPQAATEREYIAYDNSKKEDTE